MTLFKKKKSFSNVAHMLKVAQEQALSAGRTVFYFPLSDEELEDAQRWAKINHLLITLSHQDEYHLVYKFSQA